MDEESQLMEDLPKLHPEVEGLHIPLSVLFHLLVLHELEFEKVWLSVVG